MASPSRFQSRSRSRGHSAQIFKNLEGDREAGVRFIRPAHGDLSGWAEQGVLLLNTALTVEQRNAGSHRRPLKTFTDLVLRVVSEERDHVAFLLWGKHAIDRASAVGIAEPPHMIVKSAHPTARGRTKH
jgi:uracil-DNA glycosylase